MDRLAISPARKGSVMLCKRCPHLVRHGQFNQETGEIEFRSLCGLVMKKNMVQEIVPEDLKAKGPKKGVKKPGKKGEIEPNMDCINHPFPSIFDYIECTVYQDTFKSTTRKNDVIPTKDFQYSDVLSGSSITDMELL
ncbi:MAG: hypothetical protein ACOVO6_01470 [Burkholderiaceae bacterium]